MRIVMHSLHLLAFSFAACLQPVGLAYAEPAKESHTAVYELEWAQTPFGPEAAPVAGDFTNGQHITYIKFPAGMVTPVHTHSTDYVGVVITGVTRHWLPGKPESKKILPAGSHWAIPANIDHVSECLSGVECVMAIYQDAAFDFVPKAD
jgi:beta-alanine degradation protein BauB